MLGPLPLLLIDQLAALGEDRILRLQMNGIRPDGFAGASACKAATSMAGRLQPGGKTFQIAFLVGRKIGTHQAAFSL